MPHKRKPRRPRVPGMIGQADYSPRQRKYGVTFAEVTARKGWKLQEGERVVAAIPVSGDAFDAREEEASGAS